MVPIYINEDNIVELSGVTDALTGEYVNDATVMYDLKDADGNIISNLSNVVMDYVTGTNGVYRGVIPSTTDISEKRIYYVEITAIAGVRDAFRRIKCEGLYRGTT